MGRLCKRIHRLTEACTTNMLQIELGDDEDNRVYAYYSTFSIGDRRTEYTLTVGDYNGTAGDSLTYNNGHKFSTRDNDNDNRAENCAEDRRGAWWYDSCTLSNLNGLYDGANSQFIQWYDWKNEPLKFSEMKIHCDMYT